MFSSHKFLKADSWVMRCFLWGQSGQKLLIMTVLCIHEVKFTVGLKWDKGPISLWKANISKLNSPWSISCQPRHHLHLKAIWTRLPPEFVNVWANKPVKRGGCRSAEEYNSRCYCTLQDDIHIRGCHEGYHRAQRYREAASWEREKLNFLDGGWNRTIINNFSFLVIFPVFRLEFSRRSNADLVVFLCSSGLRCPSLLDSSKQEGGFGSMFGTMIDWSKEINIQTAKLIIVSFSMKASLLSSYSTQGGFRNSMLKSVIQKF